MNKSLIRYFRRHFFGANLLSILFHPFYIARRGLLLAIQKYSVNLHGKTLDLGCGQSPYKELFTNSTIIAIDIDSDYTRKIQVADILFDKDSPLPIQNNEYDNVFCSQVLEHVEDPDRFLVEINRILRVGGKLLITMPFMWGEHEQPNDHHRYTSFRLMSIINRHGFEIKGYDKIGDGLSVLFQLTLSYLYNIFQKFPKIFRIPLIVIAALILNITHSILKSILPVDTSLFLDHCILAEKKYELL